jgi:hypothetical protein
MRTLLPALATAAALLGAGCATGDDVGRSASPPLLLETRHLALDAPARIEGRLGAVQLEIRLRNDGSTPVSVVADPWLTRLQVTGDRGEIRCAPPAARMEPRPVVELAAGASLPLRVDVASRCYFTTAGDYDLQVSFDDGSASTLPAGVRLSLGARSWVNPGPR